MYDKTMTCEYTTDDEYRACLLRAFGLSEYSDELVQKITDLSVSPMGAALQVPPDSGFAPDLAFLLLFNFENFKSTHAILAKF